MKSVQEHVPPIKKAHSDGRSSIKWITCIIRPEKLDVLKEALNKLNLVGGITLTQVRGYGRQKGSVMHSMGVPYLPRFIDKIKIDIAVSKEDLPHIVTLVSQLARTGRVGDGKLFISDVVNAMRIRTGERGVDAL